MGSRTKETILIGPNVALGIATTTPTRAVETDAVSQARQANVGIVARKTTLTATVGLATARAASGHRIVYMLVEEEGTATRGMVLEERRDVVDGLLDDATKAGLFVAVTNVQSRITAGEATLGPFINSTIVFLKREAEK